MSRPRAELVRSVAIFAAAFGLFAIYTWDGSLMNGDEATYALFARNVLHGGDWLHNRLGGAILYQRPPLYTWLLALAMRLGGDGIFWLRLPSVLMGAGAALLVYRLGRRVLATTIGAVVAALLFPTLALEFRYARAVVSDATLAFFVLLAIERWVAAAESDWKRPWCLVAAGAALGAALMTKQVIGLMPVCAPVAWMLARGARRAWPPVRQLAWALAAAAIVAVPWHAVLWVTDGHAFVDGFLGFNVLHRAVANVLAPTSATYYLEVTWAKEGVLALVVALGVVLGVVKVARARADAAGVLLLLLWLAGTFVAFSLVSTRIDYYLLPAYPAFALLAALPVDWLAQRSAWMGRALGIALVGASAVLHLPARVHDVARSPELRQLARLMKAGSQVDDVLVVVDELPFAPEWYAERPVALVVTRKPFYERLTKIELWSAPGNMVHVPAENLAAWLSARGRWFALVRRDDGLDSWPPDARIAGVAGAFVLYTNVTP